VPPAPVAESSEINSLQTRIYAYVSSCLETGRAAIPQCNINLYLVPMIIVLKIQNLIYRMITILSTDGQ